MFLKKKATVYQVRENRGTAAIGAANATSFVIRRDVACGVSPCRSCEVLQQHLPPSELEHIPQPCLSLSAPILVPDADLVLHNMNGLEDSRVENILFLNSVLLDVNHRNKGVHERVLRLIRDPEKRCYVFANDRHVDTFCTLKANESQQEFNERCVRVASQWFARHVSELSSKEKAVVAVITHNLDLRAALESLLEISNLACYSFREYLKTIVSEDDALLEKIQQESSTTSSDTSCTSTLKNGEFLFSPHLKLNELENGVHSGAYLKGKLRISDSSCFFGEIRGKFEGHLFERVFIGGRTNLNRAIHDDIVAVELLPLSMWRCRRKNMSATDTSTAGSEDPPTTEETALASGYQPAGRVVGILAQKRRLYCGSIDTADLERVSLSPATGSIAVLFQPKDNRIPRIRLTTKNVDFLKDKRLSVVIDDWPEWKSFPDGHYVEVLGKIGDRETEAKVILVENDIPHYDFSAAVYDCLPKGQWSVSPEEEAVRLDLRDLLVMSVDPLGCRDIDDALHCRVINGNHLEVGVHIADVTYFLHENTPMDEEARKRSTSVYLVDRRINMLPQLLTENLCSLVQNEDRYAFSILWELDENLNVVRDWFGKTIIRSSAALYYGDAQRMIDDKNDKSEMAKSLRELMRLSRHFKAKREADGALFLASEEFKFKIDNDHVNPTDMQQYQTFEANSMIEEWMLYANAAAAAKIFSVYPRWTLLRRHQRPAEGAFDTLNEALKKRSKALLDDTSSLTLNQSLEKCIDLNDSYFNRLIRILTTRCLRQAEYFSSGTVPVEEFRHFGLAMALYTHFTSPIRRYADVIVHRQLAAALRIASVSASHMDSEKMETIAENINYRHAQAQRAGRDSQNLYTGFYLRNFENKRIPDEDGYVIRHTDTHIAVLVPKYGQESLIPKEVLRTVPGLLDKVRVRLDLVKPYGDVLRTKLVYSLPLLMKTEEEKGRSEESETIENDEAAAQEGIGNAFSDSVDKNEEELPVMEEPCTKKTRLEEKRLFQRVQKVMDKLRLLVGRFASPSVGSRLTKQELCLGFSALHKLLSTPQISSNNLRESNSSTIKEVRNALQSSVLANRVKRLSPGCSTKEIAMLAEGWSVIHWSRWDVVDHLVLSFFQLHQKRLANRNAFSNGNAKGIALQSSVLIELTVLLEAAVASSHYVNATLARVVEETLAEVLRYASSTTALSIEPKEVVFRFMCSACSYLGVKRLKEIVNIQLLSTSFPSSASSSSRNFDDKDNLSSFPSGQQEHSNLALQSTIKEFMAGLNEMHSGPFQQLQRKTLDRQGLLQRLSEGEDPALQRTSKEGARFALYSWWAAGRDQIPAQLLKEFVTLFVYHGFQDIVLQEGLEETILGVLDHSKNVPEDSNASSEEYTGVLLRGLSEAVYKRPEVFPKVRGALAAMNKGFSNSPESLQTQRAVCKAFEKAVDGIFAGEEVLSRILEELDLYTADERAMALTVLSMGRKLPEGIAQTLLSEVSGLSADGLSAIFFSLQFDTSGLLLSISEAAMQHVLNASSLQGLSFKALALLIRGLSQPVSRFISPSVSFLTLRKKFIESVVQLVVDRVHFSSLSLTEMLEIGIHMCGIDEENAVLDLICRKVSSAIKQREIVEPRFYVEILDMLMQTQYIDEELLDIISEPLTVLVVQKGVEHCLRHELSAQNADEGDCSAHRDACLLLLQFALFQSVLDAPALYPAAQLITSAVSMRMDISSSLLIAAGLLEEREGNELSVHRIISRLEESRAQDSENNFSLEISVVPFALHFLYQAKGMKPPLALLKAVSQTLEVYITATPLSSSLLISPADVARFIVVLGQSQRSEEQLAPSPTLSDFCSRAVLSFSPTLYTAIAGVLGAFKNCEPLTTEMVESLPQMLNRLSPKQISEVIFGFGQIPDAGLLLAHQLSADVASDYVVDNSELFYSGKWISRMLHGFSLLHITKRALYAVFSERLSKRSVLATMDRVSISLAMSAFGTAKFLHKGLFDKFSRIFVDHVKGLSSADLLLSIKAMSRVMLLDPQFYSTMGDEVCKKTDELSVGAQCDLLHAFGAVDLPHHQLAETVSSNIATRLAELPDANAACAVLVSLARMGYDIRGDQNVHLIADHIANHVDELSCHSTAAICAVLEEANWKHTPMLKAIAEHSVSLKKNEELTPECSRGVLDLLAKNLLHHPTARNELTPLARVVSRDVVLLSEDEALEHQLLIAR